MEKTQLQNYHVHYGPAQGWSRVDLRELWRYKDLIWLFVKRDFNVMYKQTVLGPAWILINPLMSTAMYCVMFGTIAQLSTDGVPQILFYLAGTALWGFFSSCINKVSGTFTTNSNIFSKVYFPRLAMPISTVISGLINFLVQFALFFILLLVYLAKGEVSPHWGMLLLCVPLVLQVGLLGLGCGIIVSSLTTRYRDLMVVMTFGRTGLHSLTSVTFTPHETSYDSVATFPCQQECGGVCKPGSLYNCNECPAKPQSAWPYMSQLARKYLKEEYGFAYHSSLFSMKPILKASEIDDSRPTVVRVMNDEPKLVSVLSGKINTVYDLDEVLDV